MDLFRPSLDLNAVHAFVRVVELGSFTRAAEVLQRTQAAVSFKLKRLEDRLGWRLLERTPRYVQLSSKGADFLKLARELMGARDRALGAFAEARERLTIGISDHVAGPELPALIARMNAHDPQLLIGIRIASSGDLLQSFDHREIDTVLVRFHAERADGEVLAEDQFGWFAGPNWQHRPGEPLPVATLAEPCGVRSMASRLLDVAGIPWAEVFVGGGLGVVNVGAKVGLPELPRLPVVLHSRVRGGRARDALDALSVAFQSAVRGH